MRRPGRTTAEPCRGPREDDTLRTRTKLADNKPRSCMRYILALLTAAAITGSSIAPANALSLPGPLRELQATLTLAAQRAPGRVAMEVKDLGTGMSSAINANAVMPAASTIKIPVMVEDVRHLQVAKFDLDL